MTGADTEVENVEEEEEGKTTTQHQPAVDPDADGSVVVADSPPTTAVDNNSTSNHNNHVIRVNSLPIRDMTAASGDGEVNNDDIDVDPTTIVGHLRDSTTSEQLHRLSLFEVSSMAYNATITTVGPHCHSTHLRCAAVSRTARSQRHHPLSGRSGMGGYNSQTSPSRKLAAATGFAATLMQGPYKLRPTLHRSTTGGRTTNNNIANRTTTSLSTASNNGDDTTTTTTTINHNQRHHHANGDEDDEEEGGEDEEHYLRRVARPRAKVPATMSTSASSHHHLSMSQHAAPSMLLLGCSSSGGVASSTIAITSSLSLIHI
eukprot:TRINITY_DN8475_c0_g2_i5.p1 TRINITY_DN8475_c0_g2~~TRINITY_DN8475_c0_g2_i5.p1  ORF type:complete len:317 (+),score=65.55 TRINITY_DN8475_c0_g2_i5:379-1329(+)